MTKTATKRILLVDDEEDLVGMAKRKLERNGYIVEVAYNGKEGLAKVKTSPFDLIITDVVMPVMDGFTFYKLLKDDQTTSSIPVIILTARSNMEYSFRALGVDDFLAKPFDGEKLLSKIESFIRESDPSKKNIKIFLSGAILTVMQEMEMVLKNLGYKTAIIEDAFVLIKRCYEELPDIVVIDIRLDGSLTKEVILALRSFDRLKNLKIILFSCLKTADLSDLTVKEQLKNAEHECMAAGATKYIDSYSTTTFLERLREYLT
ncbi:MAG: response regulator [Candidatus Omnitrophica bacterium]|nr:response regulator [Candidatus Omnitrophota bacterium]